MGNARAWWGGFFFVIETNIHETATPQHSLLSLTQQDNGCSLNEGSPTELFGALFGNPWL